ncbi:MAG: hypothetical protein QM731_10710 [Chitinophagaceae bacterium]
MNSFLLVILICIIVMVLIALLIRRMSRTLDKELDFGLSENTIPVAAKRFRFTPGTMPMSVKLSGKAFRYQKIPNNQQGGDFYKVFIDGSWKWKGQQRFAGVFKDRHDQSAEEPPEYKINAGHYFALSDFCAKQEILHYLKDIPLEDHATLEIQGTIDNVLDLTKIENIRKVATALYIQANVWDLLEKLTETTTGGGEIPALYGYYAHRNGYNGILFFSARAMDKLHSGAIRESQYWDDVMEEYTKTLILEEMQQRPSRMCLVFFSGSVVTRSIEQYRYNSEPWQQNTYYNYDETELDKLWGDFNSDFQAQQGRVIYLRKEEDPPPEDNH